MAADSSPSGMGSFSLQGKNALVTGAAMGIGRATALMMAARGANVIALDVDGLLAEQTAADIRAGGGSAASIQLDLLDMDKFADLFTTIKSDFGGLDILANIAGITRWLKMHETKVEDWDTILDINARATFFLIQGACAQMIEGKRGGSIVNVASIAGKGFKNTSAAAYASSKAAVVVMTRVASGYVASHNIRVNAICPGPTKTHLLMEGLELFTATSGRTLDEEFDAWVTQVPLGFAAEASDMAQSICFLASDAARFITGQSINVDGGMVFD
jgi:NAD(P)-dependent dehydrogenase (short-subunit alcohol dehydrogenase family)